MDAQITSEVYEAPRLLKEKNCTAYIGQTGHYEQELWVPLFLFWNERKRLSRCSDRLRGYSYHQ